MDERRGAGVRLRARDDPGKAKAARSDRNAYIPHFGGVAFSPFSSFFAESRSGLNCSTRMVNRARWSNLSCSAKCAGDVHADAASAWSALECSLPQRDRLPEVAAVGLDHAEVRGRVEQVGILRQRSLVQLAGIVDRSASCST